MPARGRVRALLASLRHFVVILIFVVLLAFPFYWMLISTFKQ